MIAVEIRGLLAEQQYTRLKKEFEDNGKFVKKFRRLNVLYGDYDAESRIDLRCRITNDYAEIVLKVGEPSSSEREEIEVRIDRRQFMNAVKLLAVLGHTKCLAAIRDSERYMYNSIEFTMVRAVRQDNGSHDENTMYYEAELMVEDPAGARAAKGRIIETVKGLGLQVLKDHSKDVSDCSGDVSIVSDNTFYDLVKELNTNVDLYADTSAQDGIRVIKKSLAALKIPDL